MTASLLYRVASVLLVLFAIGHTLGFRTTSMEGAAPVAEHMRSARFAIQGSQRSYWDLFVGFGFFVTAFQLFSAVLAWQLGGMSRAALAEMPAVPWAFAVCLLAVAILSWTNFFAAPAIFSTVITLCLFAAAWLSGRAG
jgi:hypothetical protein